MLPINRLTSRLYAVVFAVLSIGTLASTPSTAAAQSVVALQQGDHRAVPLRRGGLAWNQQYRNVTIEVIDNTGGVQWKRGEDVIHLLGVRRGTITLRIRGEVVTSNGQRQIARPFQRTIFARVYPPGQPGGGMMQVVGGGN